MEEQEKENFLLSANECLSVQTENVFFLVQGDQDPPFCGSEVSVSEKNLQIYNFYNTAYRRQKRSRSSR